VQSAVADAVIDSVIAGVIPADKANDLCIIAMLWIAPECATNLSWTVKTYIAPTTSNEAGYFARHEHSPSIEELIANRHKIVTKCTILKPASLSGREIIGLMT